MRRYHLSYCFSHVFVLGFLSTGLVCHVCAEDNLPDPKEVAYTVDMANVGLLTSGTVSAAVAKLPAVAYDSSFLRHSPTFLMIRGMNNSANRVMFDDTALLSDPKHDRSDYSDMFFTKIFDRVSLKNVFNASETADVVGGLIRLSIDPTKAPKGLAVDVEGVRQFDRTSPLFFLSYGGDVGSHYQHVFRYGMRKLQGPSYGDGSGLWLDNGAGAYPSSWGMERKDFRDDLSNVAYSAIWHPAHRVELTSSVLYARENESNYEQSLGVGGYNVASLSPQSMTVTANLNDVDLFVQDATNWHDHMVSSLRMHTNFKGWDTNMAWAFDKATRHLVLDAMTFDGSSSSDVTPFMAMDWTNARRPSITWGDGVFAEINTAQNFDLGYKRSTSYPRFDKQSLWKLDVARELVVYGRPSQLTLGTSITSRVKKVTQERNYYNSGGMNAADFSVEQVEWPETFNNTQFPLMPSESAVSAAFAPGMDSEIYRTRIYHDNEMKERVASFYLMEEVSYDKLTARTGLRYEHTNYDTTGIAGDDGTGSWGGCESTDLDPCVYKSHSKQETIWSPSVLLDYTVSKASHLVSSFSKTYYKPRHDQVIVKAHDQNIRSYWYTNPDLSSPTSLNFDMVYRYQGEHDTHREVGVFAKRVKGLVVPEYIAVNGGWAPSLTNDDNVLRVYGVVLDAKQPLAPVLERLRLTSSTASSRVDNLYVKGNLQTLNNPTVTYDYPNSAQSVSGIPPEQYVSFTNNITLGYEDDRVTLEITRHAQSSYMPAFSYENVNPASTSKDPAYSVVDGLSQWSMLAKARINDKWTGIFELNQLPSAYAYQGDSAYLGHFDQFVAGNNKPLGNVALGFELSL